MTDASTYGWVARLLQVAALFWVGATVVLWLKPVGVPGQSGGFIDCGSPAAPGGSGTLFEFACGNALSNARIISIGTFASSILLFALAAVLLRARARCASVWKGALVVAPVAVPLFATAVALLFVTLGGMTAAGEPFICGSALSPNTDPIAVGLCAGRAEARLVLGVAGAALGVLMLLAGRYVYRPGIESLPTEVTDPEATSI